jgi:hypothetical protein
MRLQRSLHRHIVPHVAVLRGLTGFGALILFLAVCCGLALGVLTAIAAGTLAVALPAGLFAAGGTAVALSKAGRTLTSNEPLVRWSC